MAANTIPILRHSPRRRWLAVVGSVLIAMTPVTWSTSAENVERERFSQDYEFD